MLTVAVIVVFLVDDVIVTAFAVIIVRGRVNVIIAVTEIVVVSVGVSAIVATVSAAGFPIITVRGTAIVGTVDIVGVVGVMLLIVVVALPADLFRLPPSRRLHDRWG